jgi:hypothetical protein
VTFDDEDDGDDDDDSSYVRLMIEGAMRPYRTETEALQMDKYLQVSWHYLLVESLVMCRTRVLGQVYYVS